MYVDEVRQEVIILLIVFNKYFPDYMEIQKFNFSES